MNTVQLECFLAVAEHLNFARAAETLHITQPAVTHQINSLETELNTSLFRRTTRSVELTDAGFYFIGDARNILNLANSAKLRLLEKPGNEVLPFSIGCHSSVELEFLPSLICGLKTHYPNLHPILKTAPLPILKNHLDDESLDVLFGFKIKNTSRQPGLYVELIKVFSALVVPPEHPLASRKEVGLEDFKDSPVILCDPRQNPQAVVELQQPIVGTRPTYKVYFCERIESALTLVKAGMGVTLLPDIPLMRDSSLRYIPFCSKSVVSFGLYCKSQKQHPALKKFIEITKEKFAGSYA